MQQFCAIVAMAGAEIAVGEGERRLARLRRPLRRRQGMGDRRRDQRLLRGEMAIEGAMGQTGRLHHLGDGDAVEAAFPEQPGGGFENAPPVFGDRSLCSLSCARLLRLDFIHDGDHKNNHYDHHQ